MSYTLFFDGASRGNPGISSSGVVLYKNNKEIWTHSYYIGDNYTNNQAEYIALLIGLRYLKNNDIDKCLIKGDSKLVIKQMKGEWKCNAINILWLNEQCLKISKKGYEYEHVLRDLNKRADALANEAFD